MDDLDEQISLSNGFFQALISNNYPKGIQPILQIIESRNVPTANVIRVRLSDGLFSYSNCAASYDVGERLESAGFKDSHGIIQITEFVRATSNGKATFSIVNFKPLQLTNTIIGDPKPHSGNPDEFKGIENFPSIINSNLNQNQPKLDASPSRKRVTDVPIATTSIKRQNTMPSGGVFSDGVLDIAMITPYVNKFRICGAASCKESARQINTKRGSSLVFSFVLTDVSGNSIKISAFGKECEKYSDMIQNGVAYYVSCVGTMVVREANKRFNSTGHTYEITLNGQCEIELCTDREIGTPNCKLNCIPLVDIKNHPNECVDVLAVVDKIDEIGTVMSRATQKTLRKRGVTLIDQTCTQIQFTLWNDDVDKITQENLGHAIGIKGAVVREFNGGFSLSHGSGTTIIPAPDGDKSANLYKWYAMERPNAQIGTLTTGDSSLAFEQECRGIHLITETNPEALDRGMYVTVEAFINSIKAENVTYTACSNEGCKKKVTSESNQWRCNVCGVRDTCRILYMLNVEVADFTGLAWVTLFDDTAAQLLGISAAELVELQNVDRSAYDRVFQATRFKSFEFRFRVKSDTYNDQKRLRWNCITVRPVSYDRYIKALKKTISVLG